MKRFVPWWAKVWAKVVLSRVPVRYRVWQRFDLFVHGRMDKPEYALRVVRSHLDRVGWKDLQGKSVLELGPGDALSTAVIAKALGARRTYLVDSGPFAEVSVEPYHALARHLAAAGLTPPDLTGCATLDEVLARCAASYHTRGLDDLRTLPSGSIDLCFSQAVLEHVERDNLAATIRETRRLAAPGGVASHQVDLKDHLGGALNNLRFRSEIWERPWMRRSGFYTNRVRFAAMVAMFGDAGWRYEITDVRRWARLPTPRPKLQPEFRDLDEQELLVSQFDIVARDAG
jgi:SAM-dependent methyltransferase